ncbi:MAG: hypothetical protein JKX85_10095 [Phycisphaeraceae bacterium]|nr:hypothetical protein [Phycisphaeraceae bacterium]
MILLTLDPSSTVIGYCISTGPGRLLDAGKIKSSKSDAYARLSIMMPDLIKLIEQHKPDAALVETPAPQQGQRKATSGQAIYGVAVGMVLNELQRRGIAVHRTRADEWTNRVPKLSRQRWIAQRYRGHGYAIKDDKGGDVSDAIGLADWWWARQGVMK